jgi:hypothetical protein
MAFYGNLWCMLRDLAQGGNIEPRNVQAAMACDGEVQVAHLGKRGAAGTGGWRRAPDDKTAPLCRHHHDVIDGRTGRRARAWFVELGRTGQDYLREKLIQFAAFYWDGLAPSGREEWERRAAAERSRQ